MRSNTGTFSELELLLSSHFLLHNTFFVFSFDIFSAFYIIRSLFLYITESIRFQRIDVVCILSDIQTFAQPLIIYMTRSKSSKNEIRFSLHSSL